HGLRAPPQHISRNRNRYQEQWCSDAQYQRRAWICLVHRRLTEFNRRQGRFWFPGRNGWCCLYHRQGAGIRIRAGRLGYGQLRCYCRRPLDGAAANVDFVVKRSRRRRQELDSSTDRYADKVSRCLAADQLWLAPLLVALPHGMPESFPPALVNVAFPHTLEYEKV